MHAISINIKSICFVHSLPFFLYILSKFSLCIFISPIPTPRGVPLYPPPEYFQSVLFFVYLFGLAYLLLYLIGFSNDLFSPFFYSLSMNIRFSLQFLTYSPICIVLSAQHYTLFIYHSAYFSSKTTPYRVLPYITKYYRFKLIIANPYT